MFEDDTETEVMYLVEAEDGLCRGISSSPEGPIEYHLHNVHSPTLCEERNCAIHNNPSLHPLSMEPLVWDDATAAVKRQCVHGVLHPDPDDLGYRKTIGMYEMYLIHQCDGCCGLEQPR